MTINLSLYDLKIQIDELKLEIGGEGANSEILSEFKSSKEGLYTTIYNKGYRDVELKDGNGIYNTYEYFASFIKQMTTSLEIQEKPEPPILINQIGDTLVIGHNNPKAKIKYNDVVYNIPAIIEGAVLGEEYTFYAFLPADAENNLSKSGDSDPFNFVFEKELSIVELSPGGSVITESKYRSPSIYGPVTHSSYGAFRGIISFEDLMEKAGIKLKDPNVIVHEDPKGTPIAWVKFQHNGKLLYISQRNLIDYISYDDINVEGAADGKVIDIGGVKYLLRLIDGSIPSYSYDGDNVNLDDAWGSEWVDFNRKYTNALIDSSLQVYKVNKNLALSRTYAGTEYSILIPEDHNNPGGLDGPYDYDIKRPSYVLGVGANRWDKRHRSRIETRNRLTTSWRPVLEVL